MTATNRVEVLLESTLDSVDQAEEMSQAFAREAGFPDEDQMKIGMAVREAMVNAVFHGNKWDPGKRVGLTMEIESDGRLVFTVGDEGPGFELELVPDPLASENLMKQSGRGIFLIRSFMDEIQVRRRSPHGTELRMVKLPSPENGKEESS